MDPVLETRHLCRDFGSFHALTDVSVTFYPGQLTILKGRSGSGKTTLLNLLAALDQPTSGTVLFEGRDLSQLPDGARTRLRRQKIGFVFQSVALAPMMTALENVEFALRLSGWERKQRRDRAVECLRTVGLEKRMDHLPQELSGGEQQRVAVARAVAHRPVLLLADEPTAALDTDSGLRVVRMFRELVAGEGIGIVMTTHDPGLMELGDRVYEIEDGVIQHG